MSKGKLPIYFILAIIFLATAKILQVFVFDADQYKKNKASSFSDNSETEVPEKKDVIKADIPIDSLIQESKPATDTLAATEIADNQFTESSSETSGTTESSNGNKETTPKKTTKSSLADYDNLKNIYLAPIISKLPTGQLREDVVIRYYRHEKDGSKVYELKKLGYYIHVKEATETAGLGSNVIYYGTDVSTEDIKIVAYTLLSQGIPIKSIEPTRFNWKSNAIEIGTDPDLNNSKKLIEKDIRSFTKN